MRSLIFILFLFSKISYSQVYYKYITKNNEVYTGSYDSYKKGVFINPSVKKFKLSEERRATALNSQDMKEAYFWMNNTDTLKLRYYTMAGINKKGKLIELKKPYLFVMKNYSPKLELYVYANGSYDLYKNGDIEIEAKNSPHGYYFRKPYDDFVMHAGYSLGVGLNAPLRNMAKTYFADCPELIEKIENKYMKVKQLTDIIDFYNNQCK